MEFWMMRSDTMGIPKGPTEGGSWGRRGHSGMDHWGYTEEVKEAARLRRRLNDKREVESQLESELDSVHRDVETNEPGEKSGG
jgi:hypothetical protein